MIRRRLARLALELYPLAFRRRYGEELRALVEQTPPRASAALDIVRGALAAHLRPPPSLACTLSPADRMRASASGVLACWVVFAAAGFGFYKTTEDAPFSSAARAHPLLDGAHLTVQLLAVVGAGAVVLGALPLIATALAQARRQPQLTRLIAIPVLTTIAFAGLTGVLVVLGHHAHPPRAGAAGQGAFLAWGLAGLAWAGSCVAASRRALFAARVARIRLVAALACGALTSAVMIAIVLATGLYAVELMVDAPALGALANGPFSLLSTGASLFLQLAAMTIAGTLASIATWRGLRAAARPAGSAIG